jgi:hypothetical protein
MKKKSGKGKPPPARATKDLPVSDAKARQAKGGKASPSLFNAIATGKHLKEGEITV